MKKKEVGRSPGPRFSLRLMLIPCLCVRCMQDEEKAKKKAALARFQVCAFFVSSRAPLLPAELSVTHDARPRASGESGQACGRRRGCGRWSRHVVNPLWFESLRRAFRVVCARVCTGNSQRRVVVNHCGLVKENNPCTLKQSAIVMKPIAERSRSLGLVFRIARHRLRLRDLDLRSTATATTARRST